MSFPRRRSVVPSREVMAQMNRIKEIRVNVSWRYLKQQTWLLVLPLLLMTTYGATALAAQAPSFSATASGTTNNLTVTANLTIGDADVGRNGNYYLAFNFQQAWYFNNGTGWVPYDSGALPTYSVAPLANRPIEVVRNQDVSSLVGGQLYVGYGLTESDMRENGKYAMVYTVTADTTAPTVSGTVIANGATGVAINTTVGATFSEAMNPATLTTATVTLLQGAQTVLGTVSYSGVSVLFVPSNPLASSTLYTATIKGGTNGAKDLAGNPLASDFTWTFSTAAALPRGPAAVNLGTAGNFVILAKSGVSTTGTTAVVGDIGISPAAATYITGFALTLPAASPFSTSALVTGKIYAPGYADPTPASLTTAVSDMETAYTDAAGRTVPAPVTELGAGNISGMTLVPGLYKWGTGVLITSAGVTLSGGANDVWIFQIAGNLTVDNNAIVTLSGGAQAKNIFWQVAGSGATLGTAANFKGIILSQTLISLNTGAVMTGRALAQTAVTLNATSITAP